MAGDSGGLVRVKEEMVEEGVVAGDLEFPVEGKEELEDGEDCVGEAMMDFMRRREGAAAGTSGYGGSVPGVEALPGGRVPELLGLSEQEIAQVLPSRASGTFVPYLGEAGVAIGHVKGEIQSGGRGRGRVRSGSGGRGRSRRPSQNLAERRRRRRGAAFGSGRPIHLLSNIKRETRNRPLQMAWREGSRPVTPANRQRGSISLFGEG